MEEREIVAAIRARDSSGLARAYDAYAGKLHAYCWSLLRDHEAAADALQDTFIVADRCIGQLRDPAKLRPWLYAIARNECLRQLRSRPRSVPLDEAGDMTDEDAVDIDSGMREEEVRDLVWAAAKGLNPGEYEVLELYLRHDLDGADLAAALGVSRNHAHALLSRARGQFETSLAALIVARTGRASCGALNTLLADWDGDMDVLLRKRINRHIERCDVCGERRRREVRPARLLSMLPFVLAPAALRPHVLRLVADATDESYCQHVAERAGPFDAAGFVRPLDRGPTTRSRVLAAIVVMVLLLLGIVVGLRPMKPPGSAAVAVPSSRTAAPVIATLSALPTPTEVPTTAEVSTTAEPTTTTVAASSPPRRSRPSSPPPSPPSSRSSASDPPSSPPPSTTSSVPTTDSTSSSVSPPPSQPPPPR